MPPEELEKVFVKKFNDFGSKIIASGTKDEKLRSLKNEYENISIQQFKLDNHSKIEEFINQIEKEYNGIDITC